MPNRIITESIWSFGLDRRCRAGIADLHDSVCSLEGPMVKAIAFGGPFPSLVSWEEHGLLTSPTTDAGLLPAFVVCPEEFLWNWVKQPVRFTVNLRFGSVGFDWFRS